MYFGKYAYQPIDKKIEDWQGSELVVLKGICEGEYVDYKESTIDKKKIARHLAAFANQHGGWLFFGIKEDGKERRAESFPGINKNEVPKLLSQISEISAQAIQPYLRFEEKVINGPVPEIGLIEENAIVIIGIPRGLTPPHIVKGIVYLRLHDKSEPVKDYFAIRDLWTLRENSRKKLEDFTSNFPGPALSHVQTPQHLRSRSSWAHIFLITDPSFKNCFNLKFEEFVNIMNEDQVFRFDNFFSTRNGFISRHKMNNNPKRLLPNLRWWTHGNVRLSLPINIYNYNFDKNGIATHAFQYKFFRDFLEIASEFGFKEIEIADFSYFWKVTIGVINKYLALNQKIANANTIYARIILTEMAGISPFFDNKKCIDNSKRFGVPVVEDNEIFVPETVDFFQLISFQKMIDLCQKYSDGLHFELSEETENFNLQSIPISLVIMMNIANSVGLVHEPEDIVGWFIRKISQTGSQIPDDGE